MFSFFLSGLFHLFSGPMLVFHKLIQNSLTYSSRSPFLFTAVLSLVILIVSLGTHWRAVINVIHPIGSMGLVYLPTYIWIFWVNVVNVGKYTIHGSYGYQLGGISIWNRNNYIEMVLLRFFRWARSGYNFATVCLWLINQFPLTYPENEAL